MHLRLRPLTLALIAAGTLSLPAHAQDPKPVETVTVTADSLQGKIAVNAEALEARQAQDLEDMFRDTASINVGGGVGTGQKVYLRGVEDTNLNITVDGAAQGGYLFHHQGRLNIEPELLKRVGVESGPASADSGPGALGGSVRFETKDAQDMLRAGQDIGARFSAGHESAANATSGSSAVYGRLGESLGILAYMKGRNSDDYRHGGGDLQPATASQQRSYLVKLSLLDHGDHDVRVSAERRTDEGDYFIRAHMPEFSRQSQSYQETERETFSFQHRWAPDSNWIELTTKLYQNTLDLDRIESQTFSRSRNIGGDIRNRMRFNTGALQHDLTAGIDMFEQKTDNIDYEEANGPNNQDKARNIGVFLQDRMTIGDLGIAWGARFDDYHTDYGQAGEIDGSEVSPNLQLSYQATDNLRLHAGYGEAVRGAKTREVLLIGGAVDVEKGLKPEQAKQAEIGIEWQGYGMLAEQDTLSFAVTGFNTQIENYQAYDRGSDPHYLYNLEDDVTSQGVEASVNWALKQLDTRLSYSYVDMEDENGDPLGDAMAIGASVGNTWVWDTQYQLVDTDVSLGYTLTGVERLTDVPEGKHEKPGYMVHDVRAQWQPAAYQGLTVSLAVNNLLDKEYSEHSSFTLSSGNSMPEPGRDVRLGMSYSF
jgi:hemoglobin/transferrin/lactoferrin receptor protein